MSLNTSSVKRLGFTLFVLLLLGWTIALRAEDEETNNDEPRLPSPYSRGFFVPERENNEVVRGEAHRVADYINRHFENENFDAWADPNSAPMVCIAGPDDQVKCVDSRRASPNYDAHPREVASHEEEDGESLMQGPSYGFE